MTDNKPLITYSGEIPVFQGVVPSLQRGIGAEAVEWKRAYGRSTKHVHLHPRFIPFDPSSSSSSTLESSSSNPLQAPPPGSTGPSSLNNEASVLTSLLDQPMLHTFWTDCSDVEVYRATTKDVIQSWLNSVKSCPIKEWLIILVEPSDNKKTNKLLPRTSVLDKIKNDFAQKQTERCVGLSDPSKIDSKSAESLNSMLHRIRQLLLASYSKTLIKFEENMRAQREKRNEIGWNFCHYFLLQEELAFVLEMLEVYDEALVQYDELDALFTQFVLNSHFTDTPKWLLSFQRFGDRWPALTLSSSSGGNTILPKIRETIRNSCVSLLNFRNYLFARQALLLVKQRHLHELAQRSLSFLHICINELNILDVTFTEEGSISCWVFVSCLEILGTISNQNLTALAAANTKISDGGIDNNSTLPPENNDESLEKRGKGKTGGKGGGKNIPGSHHLPHATTLDFSVHTATLWDYAREKLHELGQLCGLLPKSQLKSDHLHKVISLASGLSPFEDFTNSNGNGSVDNNTSGGGSNNSNSRKNSHHPSDEIQLPLPELPPGSETPIEKLKNALSSKEKFQHNYLELCELAMGTYKHIGRLRSARKVGLSLASYYMEAEDYSKSIVFLTEAFNTFKADKWNILTIDVLLKLAQCYEAVNDMDRYIRTCAQIACSKAINEEQRHHFFDDMMNCLTKLENNDRFIISPTEETFLISNLKIHTSGKIHGPSCDVSVDLQLVSNLPRPILSNILQMAILPADHTPKQINYYTTGTFVQGENISKGKQGKRGSGENLNPNSNNKRKDSIESSDAVENLSGKQGLVRKESVTPIFTCEDEDIALALMEMNPAVNMVDLRQQFESGSGGKQQQQQQQEAIANKEKFVSGKLTCHNLHQSLRRKDSGQVQGETQVSKTDFSEVAKTNDIIINPGSNKIMLSAKVSKPGSYRLAQVSIGVKHFELLSPRLGCRYRFSVQKESPSVSIHAGNLVAGIEQQVIIHVHTGSHFIDKDMVLLVRSSLGMKLKQSHSEPSFQSEICLPMPETQPFSLAAIPLTVKADLGTQKDSTLFEHKLIAKCPWTSEEKKLPLTFVPPFLSSYKLHSVGIRKFVQVLLLGNSDNSFKISEHQLTVQSTNSQDIPLVALNPRSQSLILDSGKSAAYMWEIGVLELIDEQPLRLEFSIKFKAEEREPEIYKYYICLQRFKTQYELKSKVEPHKGTEFCRVGNMCSMLIEISKFDKNKNTKKENSTALEESQNQQNSLMYEVRADQHMWAICGRSSGIVSLDEEGDDRQVQQVSLDVMPMSPGYLPLPTVHLSKYIPADQKGGSASNVPKLEPFNTGQVYNRSKGSQVHVLPPPQQSVGGSTGGLAGGSSIGSSLPIANDSHF